LFVLCANIAKGIPEHLQREERAPAPARAAAPAAPATSTPTAPATGTTPAATIAATTEGGADEPFNMFEAAAQAARPGTRNPPLGGAGLPRGEETAGAGAGAGSLEFLRNNPQFQQLRQLVQQQPSMLEPILQQLGQGNPQIAALIQSHPEEFLSLLADDADDDATLPPGAQTVHVTEEERDAIERVCYSLRTLRMSHSNFATALQTWV
jgi:UV excision repair protein RAD23